MVHSGKVEKKIDKLFPERKGEVAALLSEYGTEEYEREPERVRLAVLKISNGDLYKLKESIRAAKVDYRDVLAWAEYPEEMRSTAQKPTTKEIERIRRRDRMQYEAWLEE